MRESPRFDVIIIGGGIAGISAAATIAESGRGQSVLLVNGEDRPPYKRTKISKHVASGFQRDEFALRPRDWYSANRIEHWEGERICEIDPRARNVVTADGRGASFGSLIMATGSSPRPLPPDVAKPGTYHLVRTAADVEGLREAVGTGESRVMVIGLGVLGVEIAEQLCRMGKRVHAVGNGPDLMPRDLNGTASARMQREMREAGIDLHLDDSVGRVRGSVRSGFEVDLDKGSVSVDSIVVNIGSVPDLGGIGGVDLAVGEGIRVNPRLETSVPAIFAAGDVAEHKDSTTTRLWHAAEAQGVVAGVNAIGGNGSYDRREFRLKCEVFDRYFFSIGKPDAESLHRFEIVEDDGEVYRCCYYLEDKLHGVVMIDDADRSKEYERAVREGWPRKVVSAQFGL